MLIIENINKNYEKTHALKNVTSRVEKGDCFGLIGPNGAGKSTLMKIIAGVITKKEYSGSITDHDGNELLKKNIGYVPQDICLEEQDTAYQNLMFFAGLYKIPTKERKEKINKTLTLVGLYDKRNEKIKTFSGGMKRRINIGCALLHSPNLVILDEPTVGIDPQSRNYIFDLIENMKKKGTTIIYSSHYMEEIELLCNRIALIDHGEIVETGTKKEILKKHSNELVFLESDDVELDELMKFGEAKTHKEGFIIKTQDSLETIQEVAKFLRENEKSCDQLTIQQKELEDIFLELTGKELRD